MTLRLAIFLALGGTFGVLLRYGVVRWLHPETASDVLHFPWGTVTVNLLGCFFFGLFLVLMHEKYALPKNHELAVVLLTGFLGALTTFSAYAFDLYSLYDHGRWGMLCGYFFLQNFGGPAMLLAGLFLGRFL